MNSVLKHPCACLTATAALALVLAGGCTTHTASPGASTPNGGSKSVLRQMMLVEPTSLDPASVPDVTTSQLVYHTFECLTRFSDKNEVEPCLAEKWDVSSDGKTYTFHLRKGVKFHNGREFTAEDVKYSWERALNPHTASPQAANYLSGIVGLADVVKGTKPNLTGVTVLDTNTVKVEIDKPRAYFPGMLTMPQDSIVCKEAVAKTDWKVTADSFIGTGPFKLEAYKPGQQISLVAFDDYWGGKPILTRIEMQVILDKQTAYDNFKTGALDVFPDMPANFYAIDRDRKQLQAEYRVSPYALMRYVGLQETRQPLFKNPDIRNAIAKAIDREEILNVAYKSIGSIASGVLPDGVPMRGALPPALQYDKVAAAALLAKAGFPGGKGFPALTLSYIQKEPEVEAVAVIIRRNLKENLGIEVSISAREAGEFYAAENKHSLEFWVGGWIADYLDPQDFLSTLFKTDAELNFFDYHNPKFDALCEKADTSNVPADREKLYSEAHSLLMSDMAVVPFMFGPRVSLVHTGVKNWRECALYVLPNSKTTKE